MKKELLNSMKESFKSVIPIVVVVILLGLLLKISISLITSFLISSILLIIGIGFFTHGAEKSMMEIGASIGKWLINTKRVSLILIFSFILGLAVTIAEPDLIIFASQLPDISNFLIILVVGIGVGIFFTISSLRTLFKLDFSIILLFGYFLVFLLMYFAPPNFVPFSFDSSGVTTGAISVPIILTFGLGLVKNVKNSKENSFGLTALASIGPIVTMLILGIIYKIDNVSSHIVVDNSFNIIINKIIECVKGVSIAFLPILLIFICYQLFTKAFKKKKLKRIILGFLFTYIGLILFLIGANTGFMNIGYLIGSNLASKPIILYIFSFILGFFIVIAEPAIKILTDQISDITNNSIPKILVMVSLALGVGLAVFLSMFRLVNQISFLYFIIPGYIVALTLTLFSPKMFTAIAFDSGGAASGSLTATFLVPMALGACTYLGGNIMLDAFGLVAFVSMIPLITIQILGIIYKLKLEKKQTLIIDEAIIDYEWAVAE